jgi:diaminohydroxyphosphoribosylaminopyrimidine deaminase/5-amino-6-(5-phosphoribosylamino)uracil reductase
MTLALRLARRGYGATSPNPMVGALLVKGGRIIGRGWHHRAGEPHAEIEALRDAQRRGGTPKGAALYVTLEPCCTQGRTPPCTEAIIAAGVSKAVIGATDPNPRHSGRAFQILRRADLEVVPGVLAPECLQLNEAFNHWIVRHTPFVTVKAAMTMDGKIATASGESKWITGPQARAWAMNQRRGTDAILVGVNTILADDPRLTFRPIQSSNRKAHHHPEGAEPRQPRRIVLDARARTPLDANVTSDEHASLTTIVVSPLAPKNRVAALAKHVRVLVAPLSPKSDRGLSVSAPPRLDLPWLLRRLGAEQVTNLLVEGGGEVNASLLLGRLAHRITFFYAPKILGGRDARKAVAGEGARSLAETLDLAESKWRRLGRDWLLTARIVQH